MKRHLPAAESQAGHRSVRIDADRASHAAIHARLAFHLLNDLLSFFEYLVKLFLALLAVLARATLGLRPGGALQQVKDRIYFIAYVAAQGLCCKTHWI
jgi:hypothetical protein